MTLTELRERATITVDELASVLQVSRASAYEAVRQGTIPSIRIGDRRLIVPVPALMAVLGETSGDGPKPVPVKISTPPPPRGGSHGAG